jgi:hypothetical protein
MTKLKLGLFVDDKPVKLTLELSAQVHRDLVAYAEVLAAESGQAVEPAKLVAPMLARFMDVGSCHLANLNLRWPRDECGGERARHPRAREPRTAAARDCRFVRANRLGTAAAASGVSQ